MAIARVQETFESLIREWCKRLQSTHGTGARTELEACIGDLQDTLADWNSAHPSDNAEQPIATALQKWEARKQAVELAKRAYKEADQALDRFAADKDEEGLNLLAMARSDIESALRIFPKRAAE